MNIIESYLFDDKTISIDLDKFKDNISDRLFIVGFPGSGKSTLGKYLTNIYKKPLISQDKCNDLKEKDKIRKCWIDSIKRKGIIEGIYTLNVYEKQPNLKNYILNQPVIILGTSMINSAYQAKIRNEDNIKEFLHLMNFNIRRVNKRLNQFRKDRMNVPNANIKELII
jgi:adenylate kinase family enzyme|tara:strand:- start:1995 stop:2498 length:504 start_codon:yes stop_codon:yes gene_type:complete